MKHSKKLLAIAIAAAMAVALPVPAMAASATSTGTSVQITKTLNIGQGITVPSETFTFSFENVTTAEADELGETGSYIIPGSTQQGPGTYPAIANTTVAFDSSMRTVDGTDEALTFLSPVIDLADNSYNWAVPGLYIYSVKEVQGTTSGMTYDNTKYFLKVYVKNGASGNVVDSVAVYGKEGTEWKKIDGAPTDVPEAGTSGHDDGSADYAGNQFLFTNTYTKLVDHHPTNSNTTSEDVQTQAFNPSAFKLTKDVVGNYANQAFGFDFQVQVHLPASYSGFSPIQAKVNGYTANQIENVSTYSIDQVVTITLNPDTPYTIYLHHGDSFEFVQLPAGSTVDVTEEPSGMKYVPTYSGQWGGNYTTVNTGSANKGDGLTSDTIVVGENGAYIQFTNTMNDNDVTATGIVINNLPYILMVVIAVAGIALYMVSKKRRNG